ncbi:MAG: DUF1549 domain-containing protein [Verrucomicrobiota bacterium]
MTFDLVGLPPSPEEVASFVADPSADALAKVVDRLLSSPQYGRRWARYWLDVARYADARLRLWGGAALSLCLHLSRLRDQALNDDLPFDQFIIEQIAADRWSWVKTNARWPPSVT